MIKFRTWYSPSLHLPKQSYFLNWKPKNAHNLEEDADFLSTKLDSNMAVCREKLERNGREFTTWLERNNLNPFIFRKDLFLFCPLFSECSQNKNSSKQFVCSLSRVWAVLPVWLLSQTDIWEANCIRNMPCCILLYSPAEADWSVWDMITLIILPTLIGRLTCIKSHVVN